MYLESAAIAVLLRLARAIGIRVAVMVLRRYLKSRKQKRAPRKARGARRRAR